jgi:trehalose synthase
MDDPAVRAILEHVGVLQGGRLNDGPTPFTRWDGSPGRVDHVADVMGAGPAPTYEVPLVVQISRWDRLKDMAGVMKAFADHVEASTDAHLALVGPNVSSVADDPEGVEVYGDTLRAWRSLPHAVRTRVQLVNLPMHDVEENAAIVNALQRHAAVIVQKSLAEGFGLTVTEAMWKSRPVVASAVGGIRDQIVDGEHGLLVDDPTDTDACGAAISQLLRDDVLAARLGQAAQTRIASEFLSGRHLRAYVRLLADLLENGP